MHSLQGICTIGTTVSGNAGSSRITNPTVLANAVCLSLGGPRQLFNTAATVFYGLHFVHKLLEHPVRSALAGLANLIVIEGTVLVKLVHGGPWENATQYTYTYVKYILYGGLVSLKSMLP